MDIFDDDDSELLAALNSLTGKNQPEDKFDDDDNELLALLNILAGEPTNEDRFDEDDGDLSAAVDILTKQSDYVEEIQTCIQDMIEEIVSEEENRTDCPRKTSIKGCIQDLIAAAAFLDSK